MPSGVTGVVMAVAVDSSAIVEAAAGSISLWLGVERKGQEARRRNGVREGEEKVSPRAT